MIHIYITQLGNYLLENLVLKIIHITEITPEMLKRTKYAIFLQLILYFANIKHANYFR